MRFSGDLSDEELLKAVMQFRRGAVQALGEERTAEIEVAIAEAAGAVARLSQLTFSRTDLPGFYLNDFAESDPK